MIARALLTTYALVAGALGAWLLWRVGWPEAFGHLMSGLIFGGLLEIACWYAFAGREARASLRDEVTRSREPGDW